MKISVAANLIAFLIVNFTALAAADTIFESGTLGTLGVSRDDLFNDHVPGTNLNPDIFLGARFCVVSQAETTRIGGHFVGGFAEDSFFGAIVRLSGESDFPNTDDLSSTDVMGVTSLRLPHPSREVFGDLSVVLDPGWYAVVFGSGLFGTSGEGGAVRNGVDFGTKSYFAWQPGGTSWYELDSFFNNHRFVVEGRVIPEPSPFVWLPLAVVFFAQSSSRFQRGRVCESLR